MTTVTNPPAVTYDQLITEMPRIAAAISDLDLPEVKTAAFGILVRALGVGLAPAPTAPASLSVVPTVPDEPAVGDSAASSESSAKQDASARPVRQRKSSGKKSWTADKTINFWPPEKQSLPDFAGEKKPTNNEQKNTVISYYMAEVLGLSTANVSQVLAGYQACQWKPPGSPDVSLRKTASSYGWIDTSNTSAITTTYAGRRYVEYELPTQKAAPA